MAKTIKKPVPQSQIIPSTTVKGVNLADYTDYMSPVEKYITGDVNFDQWGEDRARNQSGFGKFAKSFGQAGGTFLTTVASTAGVLAGLAYAPVNEAMNEGDQDTMGDVFANPLVKAISDVDKYIKEDLMPVYYTKEQQNTIFSASTGTDLLNGLGFLASALVPNAMIGKVFGNLVKAVNAGKLGKLTGMLDDAVANGVIKVDEAGKMAGLVNAINTTGNVTGALVSRLGESAIEANDSYETIVGTLKNKRNEALQQVRDYGYADNPNDLNLTDEEIKKIATEQRNNVFGGNMLVTISDFYQAGRFFGRNPLSDKILKNGLMHEAAKKTLGQKVLGYTGEALQEAGEEGYQFLLQKGAEKSATENISFFKGISESTGDLFTTVEGQKSMLLGALLGGGASAAFSAMNEKSQNETLNSLVNNLNSNVDPKDAYVINAEGKRVIRPEFASQVTNFLLYEKMKDAALARNDREAYDLLEKKQFAETVAAKHQAGKLEEYIDELEVLGRSTPEEIKKILGENPVDENGKPLSPHEIATTKIAEARKIAKMIDGVSQIKEFARLSPQAKNHIAAMLVEQDVIAESHKNIVSEKSKLVNAPIIPSKKKVKIAAPANEFGLSDLEVEEDDYSNPIENLRKKELNTKQELLEKRYQEINEILKEYSKTPEKAEVKVAKEEQAKETAEKQIVKDNVDATNKAKSIKDKIDEAAKKNSLLAEDFKIVSFDGRNFFSSVDANGKPIIIDSKGNDVTLNFHKTYGNDYKITNLDYEEEGDGESNEEPEIVERDWSFKKPSPFATAGSSSTSKGTFNNLGDRRNLWLSKGRALFYEELNNIQDPLSLKLEIAPEYMYEELFLNDEGVYTPPTDTQLPVIIGYLYRKGKVVEKDGQKAYCVLHTSDLASNGSRFSDPNIKETLEEFQAFRDTIEDRFNKGQDSFVYINDISSGFINITSTWKPLKDILSSPAVKTGGVSIEVSMLSNDQKKPAIIIDGKDVKYVKWSGRPYIRVKVGDTASGPVYEYQELNTRNLNDAEIEQTVLPLILKYLEGNDTVELDGVKVDILTYNKTGKAKVPSILDAFLFFGTSKYSENTAIFFGKGVHARTLYFGSDANGAKFQISKNNLNNLEELKKFLKTKKRHVNKYYLPRMFTKMNIPTFSPSGDKMHEVSYLDLLAGNGPFEAGVTTNISSEGTVLNKYASFDSQIRENPNTTLKVKPRKVRKERDNGLENEEKEAINLTKPISKLQFYMLSSDEQQVYRENMQKLNDGNDETGTPMPEYDDLFKAFRKAMGEASKIAAGKGPDAIPVFPNFIDFAEEFYKDSPEKFEELKKLNNPTKAVFGKKPVKRKAYAKILDTSDKTLKIGSLVVHNDKEYVVIGIDGTVLTLTSAQGKGTQVATTTDKVFVKGVYPIQTFKKSNYIVVEKGVNDYFILSTTGDNKGKPVYEGKGRIVKQTKGRIISLAKSKLEKQNNEIPWELEGTTENDLAVQIETVLSEIGAVIKNNGTEPVTEYVDNETGEVDSNVKAETERRRIEDSKKSSKDSVFYNLIERLSKGSLTLANLIDNLGVKLKSPIKTSTGEITGISFNQGESRFSFTHKGKKLVGYFIDGGWEIGKLNEKGNYNYINYEEIADINKKYGSQKEFLQTINKELVNDIENFEKLKYTKEEIDSDIISLENSISKRADELRVKYGNTYLLQDFLKEYDAELKALEQQPKSNQFEQDKKNVVPPTDIPQDPGAKSINDDINDLFAREKSKEAPYIKGDIESAKRWMKDKMGVDVSIVDGLIYVAGYDKGLFGYFYNGAVVLSNAFEEGTEYHEAFHLVSQMYLSSSQRKSLYNEVRKKLNNYNLTDREAEEILAEDFREYVMTDGKIKYPEVQNNIFQKLLNFIKKLLGMKVETVNEIFAKINEGYYNKTKYINRLGKSGFFARTADLPNVEFSPTEHHNINEALLTYFRAFMLINKIPFYKIDVKTNMSDFEKMAIERFAAFPNSAFNKDPQWFLQHFKDNALAEIGVELEVAEEERTRDDAWVESYGKVSSFTGISDRIKFLFSSIVDNTSEKTEYALYKTIPFSEIKAYLTHMLHDKFSFAEMLEVLRDVASQTPNSIYEKKKISIAKQILQSIDIMDNNIEAVLFKTEFQDAMSLSKQPVITTLYYGNNTASTVDSMEQTVKNKMKSYWASKSMISSYISVLNGQRYISKANAESLIKMSIQEFANALNLDIRGNLKDTDLLKAIDVFRKSFFNLPTKVIKTGNPKVPEIQGFSAFMFNLEDYIKELADNDRSVREKIKAYYNSLGALMDLEAPLYDASVESQMKNSEGETIFGYVKPSYLYQRIKDIKDRIVQPTIAKGSELWEAIQYGRVTVVGVDGQRFSEQGEQGQHISTFTEEDMLLNRIVNLHQKNTVNFIQMADKKFVFGLKLDQESLIYSPDEIKFSDSDKLILSLSESHRAIEKLWDMYQNYIAYDAKMKELNYYDESGSSAGIFEEMNNGTPFTDKKQFAEKLSQYLTVNYLETLQFTSEFIGSDSRDNIKSIIPKNITDSVAGDTMQDKIKSIVAGLVLTEFITNFEQMNVFFGAPSQYKALFKRSPAIRANGRLASTDDYVNEFIAESRKRYNMTAEQLKELPSTTHHFKSVVGKDVEVASTYAEDYASRLGHKQYDKINPVDAQGIVTFEFYREYSIRTGQWSNENEDNFWKELKGESHSGLFPPMKLVHFGSETTDEQNVYYKFSVYPLLPSMIKGRQLEKIQQKLYNSGASMYIFESGNKVGAPKVKDDFYSEKVNEEATHILNVKDLKIQVDIAAKGEKMKQLFGTQLRKLINQNIADAGADIKDEKSSSEYTQTVNDLVSLEVESLSDFLDVSVGELKQGNLNETAWKKLIELFKESAIEREESDNIIIGLDYLKDQSLTIDVLPTRDKIQNLMNSLLNNRIQKQYMRGRSYVQASSVGFEYADEKSLKSAVNRGEILVDSHFYQSHFVNGVFDNSNARLGFLNVKDEKVYSAEILLPYIFKEMVQDINIITPELLEAIGYRIPTQGLNSMVAFKVVGFLPKSMDQLAAVPYEITMQSGSDFDVDKINMFLRNYFYNKKTKTFDSIIQNPEEYYASKVKKLESFISHLESIMVPNMELANIDNEYDEFTELLTEVGFKQNDYDKALDKLKRMKENPERFLKKYKKIFLQEKLFSLIRERLLDIDRFNDYINPNSAQDLEDQATEINNAQTAPYKLTADYKGIKQFFTSTNIKVAKNLWSAKQGVAQAASQGVFTALTQLNPIAQGKYSKRMYAPDGTFWTDEDGDIIFGKQNNTDGKSIMDIQANQHLTANVDAANKPFIFRLNANGITNDLHYYLISIGLPLPWVCRFMTQPIIIEYVKGMEKRKSMLNKLRRIQFNDNLTESDIVLKARAKFGGTSIPSEFLETEVDTDELHVPKENTNPKKYTQEQLLEIIKKPSLEQLDLLDDFLFYKEWATERRRIISSIKFDTEGAGKNLPESRISEYKYGRMVGSDRHAARTLYIGVEALVKNSMLKAFKENVLDLAITLYNNTVLIERQGHVAKQVLNDVFDMLYSKSQLNAENIYKIYGMLTNIILQNNLVDLDIQNDPIKVKSNYTKEDWWKEHMLSSTSVARQIASLIRSDVMKGNYLFDNLLTVDFATKDNEPDIIKFDNTVKIDADLEQVINDAFVDLKQKNPRLYQDLIKVSFFQTGVVQSVISFYKYIPVADFVAITRNLLKEPVISEKEMMAELVKNVHSIKGMANKVGRNDILDNKAGLPEFFTVDITNIKYRDSLFLTKTNQKNIALYERGLETSTTVRFNKINIKSTNKFNNGLVGQNFNIESENDETLEESESGKSLEGLKLAQQALSNKTSAWDMLTVAQSKKLNSVGITEKMFNSSTKEEQENLIKCNKPD